MVVSCERFLASFMIKDDDQGTPSILSRNTSLLEGLKRGEG